MFTNAKLLIFITNTLFTIMVSLMNQIIFYSGSLVLGVGISQYVLYVLLRVRRLSGEHKKKNEQKEKITEEQFFYTDNSIRNVNDSIKNIFQCPIFENSIRCPMINQYGFTMEKDAIEKWLDNHNTCPFTRKELDKDDLRLNKNLYNAIKFIVLKEQYNEEHKENMIKESEIFDIE